MYLFWWCCWFFGGIAVIIGLLNAREYSEIPFLLFQVGSIVCILGYWGFKDIEEEERWASYEQEKRENAERNRKTQ